MKEKEEELTSIDEAMMRFVSNDFIDEVCLSYRHDYGLLSAAGKESIRSQCIEWMDAILAEWDGFDKNNRG